ncbi:MAG: hypothetical protein K6F03_04455 [Saccharofermentans sp.]|jgi:hypothetical protein|nr:hypothetical protein [Saccharofermentans sp.]
MYLNNSKMGAYRVANGIIIAICGITSFLNLVFILFISLSSHFDHGLAETLLCLIVSGLMLIKIGIIIWRALMIHRLSKCRIYNSIIEEDHDGIIAYSSIAKMTGVSEANVIRDIMWLVRERYLINITVGRTAVRVDLLSDEKDFVTVACPTCGAHIVIRKNGGGRCDHCGTFMRLKEN